MAYERGKLFNIYIAPNWPNFQCLKGLEVMKHLSNAYDRVSHAEGSDEEGWTFTLDGIDSTCKAFILAALVTFCDDLNGLE